MGTQTCAPYAFFALCAAMGAAHHSFTLPPLGPTAQANAAAQAAELASLLAYATALGMPHLVAQAWVANAENVEW